MKEAMNEFLTVAARHAAFFTVLTVWIIVVVHFMFQLFPGKNPEPKIDTPSSNTTYDPRGIDDLVKAADSAINSNDSIIRYWRSVLGEGRKDTGK